MTSNKSGRYLPVIFYSFISIIVLSSFQGKYVLTLDMIFPLQNMFTDYIYGFAPPVWSDHIFMISAIKLLSIILPEWAIQNAILFLILFLSGISMHYLVNTYSQVPRYFAGILYAINPFVYIRFLAGHWLILLAYSIIPLAVKSFLDLLEKPDKKNFTGTLILTTLVAAFSSHLLVLLFIIYSVFLTFKLYQIKNEVQEVKNRLKVLVIFTGSLIMLNLFWILPLLSAEATLIDQLSQADIFAFATTTTVFNAVFTFASMYGFWREGYIYVRDFIPFWQLFFFIILFLAVHGFVSYYRSKTLGLTVMALVTIAIVSVILGSGIYGPFSSLFDFLFNNVFFFRGLRDSHKFAALLVFSYSYLGALGVAEFEKIARSHANVISDKNIKLAAYAFVGIALITPFVYSFTIFNGFWGQLKPTDYPGDWYEVNEFLNNDSQDFNVLFLPWHQYMDFGWIPNTQKRILNPASSFFDKPVIQGENLEFERIYSQSTNPAQGYIESLLSQRYEMTDFGRFLVPLNIKYVLLTKEVDYKGYFFLFNQTDLTLIKETKNFYIFENNHPVSRIYLTTSLGRDSANEPELITDLRLLNYTQESPVKFGVNAKEDYIVFVPPNLDSKYWELEGKPSIGTGFIAVYPARNGKIYYRRFDTYIAGYLVSLLTLVALFVCHRKGTKVMI